MKKVKVEDLKKDDVIIIYKDRGFVCYKLLHNPMLSKKSNMRRYKAVKCSVKMNIEVRGAMPHTYNLKIRLFAPPDKHNATERVNLMWRDILLIEEHDRI